jgi:hypothetical protein
MQLNFRITTEDTERLHVETHICEVLLVQRQFKELQSEDKHARYIRFRNSRHLARMNLTKQIMTLFKVSRPKEVPAATSVLPPPSDTFIHARSNTSLSRRGLRMGPLVTHGMMRTSASLPPVSTTSHPEKQRSKVDKGDSSQHSIISLGQSPQRAPTSRPLKPAKAEGTSLKGVVKTSFGQDHDRRSSMESGHSGSIASFGEEQGNSSMASSNFWQAINVMNSSETKTNDGMRCVQDLPCPKSLAACTISHCTASSHALYRIARHPPMHYIALHGILPCTKSLPCHC